MRRREPGPCSGRLALTSVQLQLLGCTRTMQRGTMAATSSTPAAQPTTCAGPRSIQRKIDREDPRAFDQIAAPQPARVGRQPVRPFEAQPLQQPRRPLLVAGQELEAGADAKRDPACAGKLAASFAIISCCGEPTVMKLNRALAEAMKAAASRRASAFARSPIGGAWWRNSTLRIASPAAGRGTPASRRRRQSGRPA